MAISRLLHLPSTWTLWCIACVMCLTICASAFPVKNSEDYENVYDVGDNENLVLKEKDRRGNKLAAPMWFHRSGKASIHSTPMWFSRMSRSGEYNPEGDDDVAKTPPLWFHRVGKSMSAPLWFHRNGRDFQRSLSLKDMELLKDFLEKQNQS